MLQARATGCSRLVRKHLIPNVMPILWAQLWITIPAYVLAETTLGMLGLGVMEPLPSWGNLLRELEGGGIASHPWLLAPVRVAGCGGGEFSGCSANVRIIRYEFNSMPVASRRITLRAA